MHRHTSVVGAALLASRALAQSVSNGAASPIFTPGSTLTGSAAALTTDPIDHAEMSLLSHYESLYAPTVTAISPQQNSAILDNVQNYFSTETAFVQSADDAQNDFVSAVAAYAATASGAAHTLDANVLVDSLMQVFTQVETRAPSQVLAAASSILGTAVYASAGNAYATQQVGYLTQGNGAIEHVITSVLSVAPPTFTTSVASQATAGSASRSAGAAAAQATPNRHVLVAAAGAAAGVVGMALL